MYLAIDGVLSAVLCISDPVREEAKDVLSALRGLGVKNAVMLTGDSPRTAHRYCQGIGGRRLSGRSAPCGQSGLCGRPAAGRATPSSWWETASTTPRPSPRRMRVIAISDGAAIAREIADITIAADSLWELVRPAAAGHGPDEPHPEQLPLWSSASTGPSSAWGIVGILPPATSAMLHNLSTLGSKAFTA